MTIIFEWKRNQDRYAIFEYQKTNNPQVNFNIGISGFQYYNVSINKSPSPGSTCVMRFDVTSIQTPPQLDETLVFTVIDGKTNYGSVTVSSIYTNPGGTITSGTIVYPVINATGCFRAYRHGELIVEFTNDGVLNKRKGVLKKCRKRK